MQRTIGAGGPQQALDQLVGMDGVQRLFNLNQLQSGPNFGQLQAQLQGLQGTANITLAGGSGLMTNAIFPDGSLALFGHPFGQIFPGLTTNSLDARTTGSLNEPPGLLDMSAPGGAVSSRSGGDDGTSNPRSTTAYASRHQAAEQRRRTRINERWGTNRDH